MKTRSTANNIVKMLIALSASSVYAFELSPTVEIHGFGTLGASMTNATEVNLVNAVTKQITPVIPQINGVDNKPNFTQENLGGLRFILGITDDISFTSEFLSEGALDYAVNTDWLYFEWQMSDQWDMKIGRVRLPLFLLSQYLKIGYTYPWTRPPIEVYNYFAVSDFSGVLLKNLYPFSNGWAVETTLGYGNSSEQPTKFSGTSVTIDNVLTSELILFNDNIRLRAGYLAGSLGAVFPSNIQNLANILGNPCPAFNADLAPQLITVTQIPGAPYACTIATVPGAPFPVPAGLSTVQIDGVIPQFLNVKNDSSKFLSFGYDMNWNHFLSIGEWKKTYSADALIPQGEAWYVLGGFNWDAITFHLTYSTSRTNNNGGRVLQNTPSSTYVNPFSLFGPLPLPHPETMQDSANLAMKAFNIAESSITAGIRYDIFRGTALKFDYRYVMPDDNTRGFFATPQGGAVIPGKRISWVTAVIDVIF